MGVKCCHLQFAYICIIYSFSHYATIFALAYDKYCPTLIVNCRPILTRTHSFNVLYFALVFTWLLHNTATDTPCSTSCDSTARARLWWMTKRENEQPRRWWYYSRLPPWPIQWACPLLYLYVHVQHSSTDNHFLLPFYSILCYRNTLGNLCRMTTLRRNYKNVLCSSNISSMRGTNFFLREL